MSTDSPLAPAHAPPRPGETVPAPTDRASPSRRIRRLRAELEARDGEIRELREQLRAIHTSDAWAILRTIGQLREAVAPHETGRDRLIRRSLRCLRRLKKLAARLSRAPATVREWLRSGSRNRPVVEPATSRNDAVVCLPVIEWHFRFQRPQHLMRQFARSSHLVLYAANRFHREAEARTRPIETNILEVMLPGDTAANVYHDVLDEGDRDRMVAAMERLAADRGITGAVVVIQHPYWTPLAEAMRERSGWPIVYDCMDDHSGFWDVGPEVLGLERRLIAAADLVVASSRRLHQGIRARSRSSALIRNACEYEHFCGLDVRPSAPSRRPTIGYYGAIAEWFDGGLVARLAELRPEWRFELIGSTLGGNVRALETLPNVRLRGECSYAELPGRIADWDAFMIPFRRLPLTEATNPVKVYEMLATGRPVVAVGLPELVPIARKGLIRLASTAEQFAAALQEMLLDEAPELGEARRAFARRNTWSVRHRALAIAIESIRKVAGE